MIRAAPAFLLATVLAVHVLAWPALLAAQDQDWSRTAPAIARDAANTRQEAERTRELVETERTALQAEVKALRARAQAADAELSDLKTLFDGLLQQEQALQAELEKESADIEALSGVLRATAKEADALIAENPITPEFLDRREGVRVILDEKRFPGFSDIQNLAELFFQEMHASGRVVVRPGGFIGLDGVEKTGQILRAGRFLAAFRSGGDTGFLRPNVAGDRLLAVAGDVPGKAAEDIAAWMDGATSGPLPLDLSNGAAFTRLSKERDLKDWLASGGLLVWPILAVGVLALALALERAVVLVRCRAHSGTRMERLRGMAATNDWESGKEFCLANRQYPGCRVVGEVLEYRGESREVLENALEEAVMREVPRLERFLPTIRVLAAVAPLLGLLGMVTGMINTFQVITIFGVGDPRMMSGGISEALITTQVGLAVAIPVMLIHHLLDRRVERIIADMEEHGAAFVLLLMRRGNVNGEPHA